jgi:hypothetical protein
MNVAACFDGEMQIPMSRWRPSLRFETDSISSPRIGRAHQRITKLTVLIRESLIGITKNSGHEHAAVADISVGPSSIAVFRLPESRQNRGRRCSPSADGRREDDCMKWTVTLVAGNGPGRVKTHELGQIEREDTITPVGLEFSTLAPNQDSATLRGARRLSGR